MVGAPLFSLLPRTRVRLAAVMHVSARNDLRPVAVCWILGSWKHGFGPIYARPVRNHVADIHAIQRIQPHHHKLAGAGRPKYGSWSNSMNQTKRSHRRVPLKGKAAVGCVPSRRKVAQTLPELSLNPRRCYSSLRFSAAPARRNIKMVGDRPGLPMSKRVD
jgi:hypothetical protein